MKCSSTQRGLKFLLTYTFHHSQVYEWFNWCKPVYDTPEAFCFHYLFYGLFTSAVTFKWKLRLPYGWYSQPAMISFLTDSNPKHSWTDLASSRKTVVREYDIAYNVFPVLHTVILRELLGSNRSSHTDALLEHQTICRTLLSSGSVLSPVAFLICGLIFLFSKHFHIRLTSFSPSFLSNFWPTGFYLNSSSHHSLLITSYLFDLIIYFLSIITYCTSITTPFFLSIFVRFKKTSPSPPSFLHL